MSQEAVQIWLNERMQGKRFVLILDDVWEKGAELLEELGFLRRTDPSNSKVIVSSRNRSTLLGTGVPEKSILKMEDLDEEDSWLLFAYHAFPYNKGNPPTNIHEGTAKDVCAKCGGLPLVIKAVGRAMASITDAGEWELAVQRLPIANSEDKDAIFHRLRLSYDALAGSHGVKLQMCFLFLAAFREDQIIRADFRVIPLWTGEGLLQDRCGHDPFEMGKIYVNLLADRCLIEPINRGVDGTVVTFRMHDVMRDLAIQIAEREEKFYCGAGRGLTTLRENECSGCTRILLNHNNLTSLPESLSYPEICSLIVGNNNITELPRRLMGGMISLTVLDLGFTSLPSLPDSVGRLKQLVFLNLTEVPITTLPPSLTNLVNLQILNLTGTRITALPYDIHKLISLRYLSLDRCSDLQCLPYSISRLRFLQYFWGSSSMWTNHREKHGGKRAASINDLGKLTQLKSLFLDNDGQAISDGTFGNLAHVETLELTLTTMVSLPQDITNMTKLRGFTLCCPHVVEMESNFCQFQYLTHLRLKSCFNLEEVPHLHK
jgi:disease resistance protein RPS2